MNLFFHIHRASFQGHLQNSTECGYLLSRTTLNEENYNEEKTSVRTLAQESGLDGEQLLTGPDSFGAFLESQGFNAVPSPRQPLPGSQKSSTFCIKIWLIK